MRLEDLERELRAERPDVDPEFARKLDDWAAAGFPRGGSLDPRSLRARKQRGFQARLERAWERLTSVPPRRLIAPAGAATLFVVVLGFGIAGLSQVGGGSGGSGDSDDSGGGSFETSAPAGGGDSGGEKAVEPATLGDAGAPATTDLPATDVDEPGGYAGPSGQCEYCAAADEGVRTDKDLPTGSTAALAAPAPDGGDGGLARGTDERKQDRSARLSLGADADEVQGVANEVVEVTDRHDGFVLDSQVTSDQGGARASFELEVPVTELDATLTDLSELADVISRTEAAEDITSQFVRAEKERARILERIEELRIDLIQADTREERLVLKSQIRSLDAQADAYEAQANSVDRRARFASVGVTITSNGPDTDGGWSLGDAVDDAGDVLRTVAGVGLVSLAVIAPLALVGAMAFWITSATRRRNRERALDA